MPVTSNDFLNSAIAIHKKSGEIDYRNAASRAYYCAFHEAKTIINKLPRVHTKNPKAGVHKRIIDALQNHSNSLYQQIGNLLKQCKIIRSQADYELSINFTSNNSQDAIDIAIRILALLHHPKPALLLNKVHP